MLDKTYITPEAHEGTLGRMFANRALRLALFEAARAEPLIDWHSQAQVVERARDDYAASARLADGQVLRAALMVGAEGRMSPTRQDAGIAVAKWDYRHRAVIAAITHEKSHENVAWEIFYPAGPFALLPMLDDPHGAHRSALVWTVGQTSRFSSMEVSISDHSRIPL